MAELTKLFENVKEQFSPRDYDILRLRYGLDDGRMRTTQEVSELFGMPQLDVKRIDIKAITSIVMSADITHNQFQKIVNEHCLNWKKED